MLQHLKGVVDVGEFEDFSPLVHGLLREALVLGASMPVAGFETDDGYVLEAAWPAEKVAVLLDGEEERDVRLAEDGWLAFHAHEWVVEELCVALKERSTA